MILLHTGCLLLLSQLVICLPTNSKTSYEGHKVLSILHNTEADYKQLLRMELEFELDFWKHPRNLNDTANVRVPPQHLNAFLAKLDSLNVQVSTYIHNVQDMLAETGHPTLQPHDKRASPSQFNLERYHTHGSIRSFLQSIVADSHKPSHISTQLIDIGLSGTEHLHMEVLKVSASNGAHPKRAIFIDGGIHAREWIAPAAVLWFIDQLVYNPSRNSMVDNVMRDYDVYLLPVVNPDGYEYTDTVRMWRKNRAHHAGHSCVGTDLNRNFPYQWNPAVGGSTDVCSDLYSGSSAASEVETQNLKNFLSNHKTIFDAYLTIHSYGQYWLYPWGYTSHLPSDWQDLDNAARYGASMIKSVHGTQYTIGSSTNTLYAAAGGSDDYAKSIGIKYSYTLELRDTGRYGFLLPERLIKATCEETFEGFLHFATYIKSHNNAVITG